MDYVEEYDKLKTKVLKYILYKKRTEAEVKQKFSDVDQDILEDIIEYLKESGYISDSKYVEKAVNEFMKLKNMSIKEIKYKLMTKGLKKNLIEEYFNENWDKIYEYEQTSASNIVIKKQRTMEKDEIKKYLMTKGYITDIIKHVLENNE